jgi:voltage-gated potassium channel
VSVDLRTLRAIRLIRLLRVLKIARYSESLQLLGRVLLSRRSELFITLVAVTVLLVVSSTLMYYAERDAQPEQFSSIPAAMWWGVETLTTIGYGDILPVTVTGKIINSFIALLGIGLFALPAGILGSGFVEELQRRRRPPARCPKCGYDLDRNETDPPPG